MEELIDPVVEAKEPKAKKIEVKKVRLTINSGEADAEKGDVFLSHNYKQILIQRDQEVVVDEKYVSVLKDAVVKSVFKDENGVERSTSVPRFSYSVAPV